MKENESRYWINTVVGEEPDDQKEVENFEKLTEDLRAIGFEMDKNDNMVQKIETDDTDVIKKVIDNVRSIVKKHKGTPEMVSTMTQPKCPKCETYTRFHDLYCSDCGTELLPSEHVDIA